MIIPPAYDCNVWIGETDVDPIGHRLERPESGGVDTRDALLEEMDRVGIDRALVYHVTARTENARSGNELLVEQIADHPRLTPCWVASPDAIDDYGSVDAFVEAMNEADVGAVRLFPGEQDYHLADDEIEPLLAALGREDALLILDALNSQGDGFTYEELGEVAAEHAHTAYDRPGLDVVVTNMTSPSIGGSFSRMSDIVDAVNGTSNLYLDTARFQIHDGLRQFVDECGVEKLLFGTHLPHASAGAGIAAVMQSSLTTEAKRKVMGENLGRLLGDTAADWEAAGRAPVRPLKTVEYPIIDIHGHVRGESAPDEISPDADGIVEQMDRTGIALCAVSQTRGDPPDGNNAAARAARRYPDRLVPFAVANPNWEDPRAELERCFDELGMRMIKIHPTSHDTPPDDESYEPIFEFANEREALVVTHARMDEDETRQFSHVAEHYPNLTLMLYHAGRGWYRADNFVQVAREYDNVLLEITFSYNVDGIIEHLVDEVGPEQVFFGTDLGARAPESQVGWATYARMPAEDRRLHMHDNALRLMDEMGALPEVYADEL